MGRYIDEMRCHICDTIAEYNEKHDSMYCDNCNLWLQGVCEFGSCKKCSGRPVKPHGKDEIEKLFNEIMEDL